MHQPEPAGVKTESVGGVAVDVLCIQLVTENGVSHHPQVHSKLMRTTGERVQFHAGDRQFAVEVLPDQIFTEITDGSAAGDLPVRHAGLALFEIHHVAGRIVQVLSERKIHPIGVFFGVATDQSEVGLLDFPVVELSADLPVGFGVSGHDQNPGGVAVQAMHDSGLGIGGLHPADDAIGLFRADSGYGKDPGGLVHHQQAIIQMKNGRKHLWWIDYGVFELVGSKEGPLPMFARFVTMSLIFTTAAIAQPQSAVEVPVEESAWLSDPIQLTFHEEFFKAGEAYFSPDGSKVIFQAVEQPAPGNDPDEFYAMFVGDVDRDEEGRAKSLSSLRRISPEGSANTCGWFHPVDPNIVLFATTMAAPVASEAPGYQRGSGRYKWMFPPEMRIVVGDLRTIDGTATPLEVLAGDGQNYTAEGSFSPDGRYLLYTSLDQNQGDIMVKDLVNGEITVLIEKPGYDGGPFFSPDGRRITYRSDRYNNNLLQVFVAELDIDEEGTINGVKREHQVTDDNHVNWCPFWHPDGAHLVYATSRVGHRNYEIFLVDAMSDDEPSPAVSRYGTGLRRVSYGPGADVLPAFNADGSEMIWTCKRGKANTSQLWVADFVGDLSPPSSKMPDPRSYSRGSATASQGENKP